MMFSFERIVQCYLMLESIDVLYVETKTFDLVILWQLEQIISKQQHLHDTETKDHKKFNY